MTNPGPETLEDLEHAAQEAGECAINMRVEVMSIRVTPRRQASATSPGAPARSSP